MAGLTGAVLLLEQAVDYGLGSVDDVPPGGLRLPTPCAGWNLEALLCHLCESMSALREAPDCGGVALLPGGPPAATDLVTAVRSGARALLESWQRLAADAGTEPGAIRVGGLPVPGETVAFIGALEIAVHGWDIAQACGARRPIPVPLALAMLRRAPMVADGATRATLFAAPVPVSPLASPSDRLVAFLGRAPGSPALVTV
jgi:uncharacterized protein (TIGR03086 family)